MNELKILVVDDESRMRKLVKDFLTRAGYQVLEAQDGEEAVDTFYSTKGINLLVLDKRDNACQTCEKRTQAWSFPYVLVHSAEIYRYRTLSSVF